MKFTQSELDSLAGFPEQLIAMRETISTFDLQVDPTHSLTRINLLQTVRRDMHNGLTAIATTMQQLIDAGA
ncbi:hypothetical protein [Chamaesiphon sp.]|uniref:hypothetical protein n=1 Tax=Chamaesiphon sp. TaxID=2814140 RepID=UPI00359413B2